MRLRYNLTALALGLGMVQAFAQAPKPQPEMPAKLGPVLRTLHQDDPSFRGGGDGADECANATVLTVGSSCVTVAGSAAGATQSNAPILCNGFTSGTALDVWFQFNATASSTTITATGIDDYDVVMEVFSGSCGALVSMGCSDNTFPPNALDETFVASTTAGQNYWVRIYSYTPPTNVSSAFTICAFSAGGGSAPANDACTGAVVENLSVPGTITFSGDNTGATVDAPTAFVIVWHAFTTTACSNVDINYCVPGSEFDDFLVNLSVNCPDFVTGVLSGTVSPDGCTLSFASLPAGTYYVPVLVDATVTPIGAYSLSVTTTACSGSAPANDDCANATTIGVNATCVATTGTTQGATQSMAPATCSTFTASAANDVWYSFTATAASTTVEVTGDGDATTGMDPILEVFSGACGSLTSLGCIDATVRGGTESMVVTTTPGSTYYYRIYYWPYGTPQTVFGFTTCVISAGGGSTPPNDDCTGAVPVALSTPGSITLSGDNTGATVDPPTAFVVVWEAFTITDCSNVTINYCQTGSEFDAFFINVAVQCPDFITGILSGPNDDCNVYFDNLAPGTYYIPVRVETDGTTPQGAYSIQVSAVPCGPVSPYCEASANSLQFEKISNVNFAGIDNNSTSNAGYEDFTGVTGTVVGGVDYPISVTIAAGYETDEVRAWIDWNQDQDFDDAGEEVFVSAPGEGPHTGMVSVPATATMGVTRMRIRLHDTYVGPDYPNTPNPLPCDTSTYGQVEDYSIDMIGVITGASSLEQGVVGVFPNPNDGNMTIVYAGANGTAVIELVDATGRIVHAEQRAVSTGALLPLAVGGKVAHGSYTLRMTGPGGELHQQRVVVR